MRFWFPAASLLLVMFAGCGTTRSTDTKRTATEQLLISDAMDRAISRLDFRALAGKKSYLDPTHIKDVTDQDYLVSSMRQHMLASGCLLLDNREEADYIVEPRAGAIGTDRHELLLGVPATNMPASVFLPGISASTIPEIPLAKKTEQRAVAKIAVFAYNRKTGHPVWQSGIVPVESRAKDVWVFGAGPFQRGSIYSGTNFAGDELKIPLIEPGKPRDGETGALSVADEAYFVEPKLEADKEEAVADDKGSSSAKQSGPGETAQRKGAAGETSPESSRGVIPAAHRESADPTAVEKSPAEPPAILRPPADQSGSVPVFPLERESWPDATPLAPLPGATWPDDTPAAGLLPLRARDFEQPHEDLLAIPVVPDRLRREPAVDATLEFQP